MMVFPGIRRQECTHSVYSEPQMDLLAPSCWDAPEASAHSSYCAISWTCPQLYNTASVPDVTSQTGTPGAQLASLTGAPCLTVLFSALFTQLYTLDCDFCVGVVTVSLYFFAFLNFFNVTLSCTGHYVCWSRGSASEFITCAVLASATYHFGVST